METLNYKKVKHTVSLTLCGTPAEVFHHVADLSKWWPEDIEGEIKSGAEFIFTTWNGHFSRNKVVEFKPGEKLVWLTTESRRAEDEYDWTGTQFIFYLKTCGEETELLFTYDGVVLEHEYERLVRVCDMCIKEMLYEFVVNGKTKDLGTGK